MTTINFRKKMADSWFAYLQSQICKEFEFLENNKFKFSRRDWKKDKEKEGGGTSCLLSGGKIFDKVGVNKSTVSGIFPKQFRSKILGAEKKGDYWASGVSVVAHMKNPKIPALHFNTRFIVTSKEWFGGGMDVTPSHTDNKENKIIHDDLKKLCLQNKKNYKRYKQWCDEYFYLPHRKEPRGIGGIFFDYEQKNWIKDFKFVRELGLTFINISNKVINKKKKLKWSKKDKEKQLIKRGRYVEFNLLYDRGTKFGLNSGGNIDSILMSLPPEAKWK
ncbi:oxygen-dependent coproporphyrinogen oxidase [Pelagibacteraceae bacterium]|jgi:coproporphyrinogen III oxidase|nr:oxygen-dependent coproporphyrinogen oxidase [Pelagibacteraceae bacterium]MDC0530253.1 oxygen-dependent coproporphyrinogen oxidase [Pelagibacteraceae bacterium]MDC0952508.1 oxygen-dependent coproporphyrinogen oxidase [Pelagibacteraceae bacterium]